MTDPALAELRTFAWRTFDCDYCDEHAGRRCISATGERVTPHLNRLTKARTWQSRQPEFDALNGRILDIAADLEQTDAALTRMTAERDSLRLDLAAANREVTGLNEANGVLTRDLEATRAERNEARGRVNELTGEVDGLNSIIRDMDGELDDLQRRYDDHMATHQPGGTHLLIGAAVGGNSDPAQLEAALGHPLAIRRTYYGASTTEQNKALTTVGNDHKAGRIPYISFKLPHSWADMAAGMGDGWALSIGAKLRETGKPVRVVFHHEPEGDGDINAWVAMQRRILPLVASEHVKVGICLTGYPQVRPAAGEPYAFEKLWPGPMAQFLSVDLYQRYGTTDAGLKWTPLDEFFGKVAAFAKSKGVPWGLGETGVTDEAMEANPRCLDDLFTTARKHGAEHLAYFNSSLNSKGSWVLTGPKLTAYAAQANQ